jgi:hypothetical protein
MYDIHEIYNKLNALGWIKYANRKSSFPDNKETFYSITYNSPKYSFISAMEYFTSFTGDSTYNNYIEESKKSPIYIENDDKLSAKVESHLKPNTIYKDILKININNLYPSIMITMGDQLGRYNYPIHIALNNALNIRAWCKSMMLTQDKHTDLYKSVQLATKAWINYTWGMTKTIDLKFTYGVNQGIKVGCDGLINRITSIFPKGIGYVDTDTIFVSDYTRDDYLNILEFAKKSEYDIEVCKTTIAYDKIKSFNYLVAFNDDGIKAYAYDNDISEIVYCNKTKYTCDEICDIYASQYEEKWKPMLESTGIGGSVDPKYYGILAQSLELQSKHNHKIMEYLTINNESLHDVYESIMSTSLNLIKYIMSPEGIGSCFLNEFEYAPNELIMEFDLDDLNKISTRKYMIENGVQITDIFIDELHSRSISQKFRGIFFDFSDANSIKICG